MELETRVVPEVLQLPVQVQVHLVLPVRVEEEVQVAVLQVLQVLPVLQIHSPE